MAALVTQWPSIIKPGPNCLSDNDNVSQTAQLAMMNRFKISRERGLALIWAFVALSSVLGKVSRAGQDPVGPCLAALARASTAEISCEYIALLTDSERADMQSLTRGLLQDASCRVQVRIARNLVKPALTAADYDFTAPPQPVACEIKTEKSVVPLTGTFAPHVVFMAGEAVEATPGLADIKGVNSYLAWPVVQYVNRSPGIRRDMLAIINAYKAKIAASAQASPERQP